MTKPNNPPTPERFRNGLLIDCSGSVERLNRVATEWQRADFAAMDEGWANAIGEAGDKPYKKRYWIERPKGGSKTTDIAVMVAWALYASPRRITGIVAAGDQDQAKLVKKALQSLIDTNAWLNPKGVKGKVPRLVIKNAEITNPATGSICEIITSDSATAHGHNCHFYICDEVTHWSDKGEELYSALLASAGKRKNALFIVITNAGCGVGVSWQWRVREYAREQSLIPTSPWHFSRLDGPGFIPASDLQDLRGSLPTSTFQRYYLNTWQQGLGDGLSDEDVLGIIDPSLAPITGPHNGYVFTAGLDIGVRNDATALVVLARDVGWTEYVPQAAPRVPSVIQSAIDCGLYPAIEETCDAIHHPGDGLIRLAACEIWTPSKGNRVSLEAVRLAILELHQRFGLSQLAIDPSQGEHIYELLRNDNVPVVTVPQTLDALQLQATTLLDAVRQRQLRLAENSPIEYDLRALMVKHIGKGFRFVSPRTRGQGTPHGDSATALMLALTASRNYVARQPRKLTRPLFYEWDEMDFNEPVLNCFS